MEENARKISELGRNLYEAMRMLGEHFETLGTRLKGSLDAYNQAVGSLEGNVLVKARKFKELQAANGGEEIKALEPIDRVPRMLQAPELTDGLPFTPTKMKTPGMFGRGRGPRSRRSRNHLARRYSSSGFIRHSASLNSAAHWSAGMDRFAYLHDRTNIARSSCQSARVIVQSNSCPELVASLSNSPGFGSFGTLMRLMNRIVPLSIG